MDSRVARCATCGAIAAMPATGGADPPSPALPAARLTKKERQILDLVQRGLTNDQIARQLFVTRNTVKFHLKQVYRKMEFRSRRRMLGLGTHEAAPPATDDRHVLLIEPSPEGSPWPMTARTPFPPADAVAEDCGPRRWTSRRPVSPEPGTRASGLVPAEGPGNESVTRGPRSGGDSISI